MHVDAWLKSSSGDTQGGLTAARELMQEHRDFTLGTLGAAYAGIAARRTDLTTEALAALARQLPERAPDRKSTRLNSSHLVISYAVFCLKKKNRCSSRRHCGSSAHA